MTVCDLRPTTQYTRIFDILDKDPSTPPTTKSPGDTDSQMIDVFYRIYAGNNDQQLRVKMSSVILVVVADYFKALTAYFANFKVISRLLNSTVESLSEKAAQSFGEIAQTKSRT
jgi:hypothetical protein